MDYRFSEAICTTPKSFIREILKLTQSEDIISFAGGLPNKQFFPVEAMRLAADKVLREDGQAVLQYTTTEGYFPLRQWIADRYAQRGCHVSPEQVLIVTGSQQALDLIGKVFLDKGDYVALEKPSYLGAIQAFRMFQPKFHEVLLEEDGVDVAELAASMAQHQSKFFYGIPNFQNPTGLTYSLAKRQALAEFLISSGNVMIEDDPYGELRFIGHMLPPVFHYAPHNTVLMGSFSKICAPGLRIGWVVATPEILDKLTIAKQAADLHSSYFAQRVLCQYLQDNDIDQHIQRIRDAYLQQRTAMVMALREYMPPEVRFTEPEGGMFLWLTLPESCPAMALFPRAVQHKVAFVPGEPFSTDEQTSYQIRMSYCTVDSDTIVEGVKRLAAAIREQMALGHSQDAAVAI